MESILSQIWCFRLLFVHLQGDSIHFMCTIHTHVYHAVGWEEELQNGTMPRSKGLHC